MSTPPPIVTAPGIEALRGAIDRIDRATADLLVRRSRMARRVALLKLLRHREPRDPRREAEVLEHYAKILQPAGWSRASLDAWLATMLQASRDLQTRLCVAIQGGPGSWSEKSLRSFLPTIEAVACETVEEAWRACRAGQADAVWLAAHNSVVGEVQATAAVRREAERWAELVQPIRHALLARPGVTLRDITRVEAHPLAFGQCEATLARLLPGAERVAAVDGAHAARRLPAKTSTAVLASSDVAGAFGLTVLQEPMNDAADNRTTFQLLLPKEIF